MFHKSPIRRAPQAPASDRDRNQTHSQYPTYGNLRMRQVNDLRSVSGGLPLDSTAPRHTEAGVPLWRNAPRQEAHSDRVPVLAQHAEQGAFSSTEHMFPRHGVLAWNPAHVQPCPPNGRVGCWRGADHSALFHQPPSSPCEKATTTCHDHPIYRATIFLKLSSN